ncbi:MAG: hypothetical protein ABIP79_03955 [Chitinophagaceae bacterium]
MQTPKNQTGRNIFSVIAGVLTSVLLFSLAGLILLLFIASKAKGHGEENNFAKASASISISVIITTFICCALGGFVTGKISTKNDIIHGSITAVVLIFLLAYISEFKFTSTDIFNYLIIIPFTLAGVALSIRMKKRKII